VAILATTLSLIGIPAHQAAAASNSFTHPGYWLAASDGGVYHYGTADLGSMRGTPLNRPVVGGAATANGLGFRLVASDGGVFSFGNAPYYGSTGGIRLNQPIVGMATDPATGGYWLVASDGGIFAFHAPFFGSTGAIRLARPVVGMAATPDAKGYWLVASDGGIFAFGDAHFYGSTGAIRLARPVVGMASAAGGRGYWLVASDGGIFAFGVAPYKGSTGNVALAQPIVGMAGTADGRGYWMVARDGGIFAFGDAPFEGSTGGNMGPAPIVGMMATSRGFPFLPGATGYDISQYQCGNIPGNHVGVAIVQASGGAINAQPNSCYAAEAAWAGSSLSSYIFMNPLPAGPPPAESRSGPAGNCNGNVMCESYNFGWYWARYWVSFSRGQGYNPSQWWLDVEFDGGWNVGATSQPANGRVVAGAVAGLESMGVEPGIYATQLQWGQITGNSVSFPGIPLWVPGAGNLNTGSDSAVAVCAGGVPDHGLFAGGDIILVQYGYGLATQPIYDPDYACA
jgi:hypothetical protein